MACEACEERGKTWQGEDPKCAFLEGAFNSNGWMCATANMIRDLAVIEDHDGINHVWHDDQNYLTTNVGPIRNEVDGAITLWVTWYKDRGRTEGMWLLFNNKPPRQPTEAECLAIYNQFASYI